MSTPRQAVLHFVYEKPRSPTASELHICTTIRPQIGDRHSNRVQPIGHSCDVAPCDIYLMSGSNTESVSNYILLSISGTIGEKLFPAFPCYGETWHRVLFTSCISFIVSHNEAGGG